MKLNPAYIAKTKDGYKVYKGVALKAEVKTLKEAKGVCADNGWMYIYLRRK